MEFIQWKLRPKWYYSLFHNNYKKNHERNIYQYSPTLVTTSITRNKAEVQAEETDIIYKQELAKHADKTIDYQYTLTHARRRELSDAIYGQLAIYSYYNGNPKNAREVNDEIGRIIDQVIIIHESHMGNALKREAYLELEGRYIELLELVTRMANLQKRIKSLE